MWSAWGDVDNGPHELATRGQVLEKLETLVGGLQFSHASMGTQWKQTRENLGVLASDVNEAAETVATLNGAIQRATQAGLPANDLTDQRDLLIMRLGEQVGAVVRPAKDGMLDVVVGGMSLVTGKTASTLAVAGSLSPDDVTADPPRLVTESGGFTVRAGGTAAGQLHALKVIIPGSRADLDAFARNLATALNTQHKLGFDLNGNGGKNILGAGDPLDPLNGLTASTIGVLISDKSEIAASKIGMVGVPPKPALDSSNADEIGQLRLLPSGPDANYRAMIVELGVQAAVTERNYGIQQVITTQVDAARESVAGVNLDEEMTNMLSFQHAYSAAGRLVTAIDETLDMLINRTGLVGR
jgi:flagellar hook-associated protein 1 FlgK